MGKGPLNGDARGPRGRKWATEARAAVVHVDRGARSRGHAQAPRGRKGASAKGAAWPVCSGAQYPRRPTGKRRVPAPQPPTPAGHPTHWRGSFLLLGVRTPRRPNAGSLGPTVAKGSCVAPPPSTAGLWAPPGGTSAGTWPTGENAFTLSPPAGACTPCPPASVGAEVSGEGPQRPSLSPPEFSLPGWHPAPWSSHPVTGQPQSAVRSWAMCKLAPH